MKLLLGSNSPRRKELLEQLGFRFSVVSINCDEIYPENMKTEEIAGFLSKLKANAFQDLKKDELLLTADTIVTLDNNVLGKPQDQEQARSMLMKLSGKTHQVFTGVTIRTTEKIWTITDVAHVEFEEITSKEIEFYLQKYHPFDKAGSYGIQEWLGMAKIKKIDGSFYTIMGLPTHLIYAFLHQFDFN